MNNLFKVLEVANRFLMTDLIASFVSEDTFKEHGLQYVWQYISFAVLVIDSSLINRCLELIDENVTHVLDSPDFIGVSEEVMAGVVGRDAFPVNEIDLFKSLIKWSIASCQRQGLEVTPENQRKVMDSFIHRIRFPLMNHQEFNENVVVTDILSKQEYMSILKCISSLDKDGSDFDCKPRETYSEATESLVKDVTELKCMNLERPGEQFTRYFYCQTCQIAVCFVCASMCHESHVGHHKQGNDYCLCDDICIFNE